MGTLLKFQPRLRVHYIELSDLTNSVPNIPLLKKNADIGRQTQILSDLHSDDKKRRDVGKRTLHEDTKRLAIKSSREKQTLDNNIDPSSILISEGEENLIDLASKIKSEREALAAELSKYPEQEKQYLNSKTDADLARTLMNALTDSYMTNSTGYSPYSYINPYSPEGQDRLDFATSNAALSLLSSVATGASIAPVGAMLPIIGPFGTAIAVGEGVGGDLLGRYLMSKVTDNPYALTAGGALGGSLGAFHGAGTTQRMLETAMRFSNLSNPAEKAALSYFGKYMFKNAPYILFNKGLKPKVIGSYGEFTGVYPEKNGDLINAYIYGEPPVEEATRISIDLLSPTMLRSIMKRYPDREVPIWLMKATAYDKPYTGTIPQKEATTTYYTKHFNTEHNSHLYSGENLMDVAGHQIDIHTLPNGNVIARHADLWKFYPEDYIKKWHVRNLLSKLGLHFVDKTGHPFVMVEPWHYIEGPVYGSAYQLLLEAPPYKKGGKLVPRKFQLKHRPEL